MSHRIKRFSAFAIFALFYHFAAVDSILGFGGHHVDTKVDTKTATATTEISLSDELHSLVFVRPFTGVKIGIAVGSSLRRRPSIHPLGRKLKAG